MEIDLVSTSKEYFSNMNMLAKKISTDIENTREAYQDYWHSLSTQEQNQVIDESIITPSALIRYAHLKMLITENPNIHSWFTKSQLDLNEAYAANPENNTNKNIDHLILHKKLSDIKGRENHEHDFKNKDAGEEKQISNKLQSVGHKSSVLKPKNPPPPPPSKSFLATVETDTVDSSSGESEIPKTGFDFLDNW